MIKKFGAFRERAGRPKLRTARFFDPRGRREEKVQESLRWLDLARLRDVTFWVRARPGVDFRFFPKK